jgi:hypothetical protein
MSNGEPRQFRPAGALGCHHCGAEDRPALGPGKPPHALRASYRHCGGFLTWVSGKSLDQRAAARARARRNGRGSPAQLAYLERLGYRGPAPETIEQAHNLIERLLAEDQTRRWS